MPVIIPLQMRSEERFVLSFKPLSHQLQPSCSNIPASHAPQLEKSQLTSSRVIKAESSEGKGDEWLHNLSVLYRAYTVVRFHQTAVYLRSFLDVD